MYKCVECGQVYDTVEDATDCAEDDFAWDDNDSGDED